MLTIIRPQTEKKKQELAVQHEWKETEPVWGDAVRFRQILMNLLSNAVKYMPEGGKINFSICETERTDREKKYEFKIEDNGIGMTPEFVECIFDPFTRADDVKEIQGTWHGDYKKPH